jgi:hypothetical protein
MALDKILATSISGNVITVTSNSASTINANSINFLNSSSVKVSVEQGSTGVANVTITPTVTLGLLIALSGD